MKTKEILEARWKVITFALLVLIGSAGNIAFYPLATSQPLATDEAPPVLQNLIPESFTNSFDVFVWEHWFATNGPFFMAVFAAILGGGLIANEVSKGTIFFLLSKPISRDRILLTKYSVSAVLLLAVSILGSVALAFTSIALGHPIALWQLLVATVLLWLAALFPLGLALFFSLISPDSLRPVVFSLLITLALTLVPAIVPGGLNWSLGHYWSNLDAYLSGSFPLNEYIVCFVAAALPLCAALIVFRRKAY